MSKLLYTAKHMMSNYTPGQLIHVYKLNRPFKGRDGKNYHYYLVKDNDKLGGMYASKKYFKDNFEPMREVHPFNFKPLLSAFVFSVLAEVIKPTEKK